MITDEKSRPSMSKRIKDVIREGDYADLVSIADELGKELVSQRFTTSQIRTIFAEIKRLQNNFDKNRLQMLKPKLAYMAARSREGGRSLREVLSPAVDEVIAGGDEQDKKQRFRYLSDFFEAVLAYHKSYGGRD